MLNCNFLLSFYLFWNYKYIRFISDIFTVILTFKDHDNSGHDSNENEDDNRDNHVKIITMIMIMLLLLMIKITVLLKNDMSIPLQ